MFTVTQRAAVWAIFVSFPVWGSAQAAGPGTLPPEQQTIKNAEGAQAPAKSGQETGSPHPVQLDAQHRPITAGGFVKSGPVVFEDASEKAGLTSGRTRWGRLQRTTSLRRRAREWRCSTMTMTAGWISTSSTDRPSTRSTGRKPRPTPRCSITIMTERSPMWPRRRA